MSLAALYTQEVMQSVEVKRMDIYGDPGQAVLDGLVPVWDMGACVHVVPHFAGFSRLPESDRLTGANLCVYTGRE